MVTRVRVEESKCPLKCFFFFKLVLFSFVELFLFSTFSVVPFKMMGCGHLAATQEHTIYLMSLSFSF